MNAIVAVVVAFECLLYIIQQELSLVKQPFLYIVYMYMTVLTMEWFEMLLPAVLSTHPLDLVHIIF